MDLFIGPEERNGFRNSRVFTVGLQVSGLICSKAIGFRSNIELKSHKAIGPPPKAIPHDFLISIYIRFFAAAHVCMYV